MSEIRHVVWGTISFLSKCRHNSRAFWEGTTTPVLVPSVESTLLSMVRLQPWAAHWTQPTMLSIVSSTWNTKNPGNIHFSWRRWWKRCSILVKNDQHHFFSINQGKRTLNWFFTFCYNPSGRLQSLGYKSIAKKEPGFVQEVYHYWLIDNA